MGIFDIFKPKKSELSIEMLLQKAANESSYRAEFYKRITNEDLIVITQKSDLENGNQVLKENTNVNIFTFENGMMPIFTTTDRIFDKGIVKEEVSFLQMKASNLFKIAKETTFILNPYSDFSKELLPIEVEKILDGTIISENHQQLTIKNDTEVQIGQPSVYPTEIINSLKVLFENRPNVNKAYLGWIFDPASGEPPHYIFGIDAESDFQNLINEAGFTVKEFLKTPEFVDFIKIESKNGLSNYFVKSTKPFYEK
jgi:hypothetical protein